MIQRATSFGEVASEYDRYRPAPPEEAAAWLLPNTPHLVVDLCAGTGGFSRVLERRAEQVLAVDLDLRMIRQLKERSEGIAAVRARGEILPLRRSSVDAVVVSSGWHWLEAPAAVSEAARVLRPGGILGIVWSGPRRDIGWIGELLGRPRRPAGGIRRRLEIQPDAPFSQPLHQAIDWSMSRTPLELAGLAQTYSRVITASAEEKEAVAHAAEQAAKGRADVISGARIEVPMRASCWKATRLPD
jgi:ubiquinone/menaquinone biosynthesis C-methylase UbiE